MKAKQYYDWVIENSASQSQAAAHFGVFQGNISRALKNYCLKFNLPMPDRRKKCFTKS